MPELTTYPTVREAIFYQKLRNDKVRCGLCERRCEISPDTKGVCKTRININGKLYTLVYGDVSAIESRPIEIKPFFHYWPGSTALTFSTWSCNLNCVWCLPKETPILTSDGIMAVNEVVFKFNKGESVEVLSHSGRFRKVLQVFEHPFHGELVALKPAYLNNEIAVTPNHRVLTYKNGRFVKVRADRLQIGDLLIIPIPRGELKERIIFDVKKVVLPALTPQSRKASIITPTILKKARELRAKGVSWRQTCKVLGVSDHLRRAIKHGNPYYKDVPELIREKDGLIRIKRGKLWIPRFLVLDKELARLIGYYLAEGYVTKNSQRKNGYCLAFVFHENERDFIEDVASILRRKTKVNPTIRKDKRYHACSVSTCSTILALFFKRLFGADVYNKKIPMKFLFMPRDLQREVVKGLFRGDGLSKEYVIKSYPRWKTKERIQITSDTLRTQIYLILCRLGFIPSEIGRDIYFSDVAQTESMLRLMYGKPIQLSGKRDNKKKLYGKINDKCLYLQIRQIERRTYKGAVYNLEVEEDHTFSAPLITISNCQNHHLSKLEPKPARALYCPPEKVVELAILNSDVGLCASFQEPTLLTEWAIPLFKLAKEKGIKYCCYVSNGYLTLEALKMLHEAGMDGIKIDVKGNSETYARYCGGADVEKIWRNAREAKRMGLHVEIVNLVVRDVNDDEESLRWVIARHLKEVGAETPLHFTRYFPAYKFNNPPTKVETLEKAYEMAKKAGVFYPYVGNVSGHKYENTYCPNCGEKLVKRYGCYVLKYRITEDKKCPRCGTRIPVTGEYLGKWKL